MSPNLEEHFNSRFSENGTRKEFAKKIAALKGEISPAYTVFLDRYASQVLGVLDAPTNITVANDNGVREAVMQQTEKVGGHLIEASRKRGDYIRNSIKTASNDNWGSERKAA